MRASLDEILATLEQLRQTDQPDVSAKAVARIVETEAAYVESRGEAVRAVSDILDEALLEVPEAE